MLDPRCYLDPPEVFMVLFFRNLSCPALAPPRLSRRTGFHRIPRLPQSPLNDRGLELQVRSNLSW